MSPPRYHSTFLAQVPSEYGTDTTAKASFWPWLSGKPFKSFPLRSEAESGSKLVRGGATVLATSRFAAGCARRFRANVAQMRAWHIQDSHGQNMAHIRQSRPDPGLGFQVKVSNPFLSRSLFARKRNAVASWCGAGRRSSRRPASLLTARAGSSSSSYLLSLQVLEGSCGTDTTVKARFWPWLSGKSHQTL